MPSDLCDISKKIAGQMRNSLLFSWRKKARSTDLNGEVQSIFDGDWYAKKYSARVKQGDAWQHFLEFGKHIGLSPNPLFDTQWYQDKYPEAAGSSAAFHYAASGAEKGYWTSPLFESDWYLRSYGNVKSSGLNPLAHYLWQGRHKGHSPTSWSVDINEAEPFRGLILQEDFDDLDLVGYFPSYASIADLKKNKVPADFFSKGSRYWIAAPAADEEKQGLNLFEEGLCVGGQREIISIDLFPTPSSLNRRRSFFPITFGMHPNINDAVHLLGSDPDSQDVLKQTSEFLSTSLPSGRANLLVDTPKSQRWRQLLIGFPDINIVNIGEGVACYATDIYQPNLSY